jgi:DNA polymerase
MGFENEHVTLTDLLSLLGAQAEYHRAMGLEELLAPAGQARGEREAAPPADTATPAGSADRGARLAEVAAILEGCARCPLHAQRRTIVFGVGDPHARLVFVGEGPGADEDRQGEPFVGAAGQLLTKIIKAIGLEREEVYICNVVKCRPPGNRTPEPDEQATCSPFLERQLEIISPEVIVALGATAANYLLGTQDVSMRKMRGRFHQRGDTVVMPTYHPAYLLRNPDGKRFVWDDMKQVRDRLGLKS